VPAMPPKPNIAAISATIRNVRAQFNMIVFLFSILPPPRFCRGSADTTELAILMPSLVQVLRRAVGRHPRANASGLRYNNLERPYKHACPATQRPPCTSAAVAVAGLRSTWAVTLPRADAVVRIRLASAKGCDQ